MKPTSFNRFAFLLVFGGALATGSLFAQTVEINPSGAIPANYTLAPAGTWEWNTDGDLLGWTANSQLLLDAGTPIGGIVSGTVAPASADPTFTSPIFSLATPYRVIMEFRIKKESTDTSRIDLFWDDANGGFSGVRLATVAPTTFVPDDTFKVVRISFPAGRISNPLKRLRLDPVADAANAGKTMQLDYFRIYTESIAALSWDPDTVTTGAQGGSGTWDQGTTANWWNGTADVVWPATGTSAVFAGTAGTVTVSGTVNSNFAEFQTTGYTVTGGIINIGTDTALYNNAGAGVSTRIDSVLQGSAPLLLKGTTFVLSGNNTALTGPVTQGGQNLGIASDTALGTGTYTSGTGGNTFISALGGDRVIANNVVFAGNRMILNNNDLGSLLPVGNLTIGGNLALNCISPGDLFLRKALTVNGVVSGSNSGIGLFLAGDSNIIRLANTANTFTGGVKWATSSTIEVSADGGLGAAANALTFNAGAGTLRPLASFASARAININGFTTAKIDTNGFNLDYSGVITGASTLTNYTTFQKVGAGKLTLSGTGSTLYGGVRIDEGTCDFTGGSLVYTQWNGNYGVGGGAQLNILGGTYNAQTYLAIGNSVNPTAEALLTVNGGTFICGLELLTAQNGNGRFSMISGSADLNQLSFGDGADASRIAIIDLDGGNVSMNRTNRRGGLATATINFNGSTITLKSDQTDLLRGTPADTTYAVKAGGAIFNTVTFNATIAQPLVHSSALGDTPDGGLTKSGTGTLTLAATNTYTGPTKVTGGVLSVNGVAVPDAGKLDIAGGKVLIPAATVETVKTLFFNGVQQPAGVYGSSAAAGAGVTTNDTYFDVAGAGTISVTSGPGTSGGYAAWAAAFTSPPLSNTAKTADPDNDGLTNLVEYALGKDPRFSSGPAGVLSGNTITYTKGSAAISGGDVSWTIETSETLAVGSWTVATFQPAGDTTATIQYTFTPSTPPKKFARLKVTSTP